MKKIAVYILFILSLVFSSCQEKIPTPEIKCHDDEVEVNGVCQKVKTDFEKTFDAMDLVESYTLNVSIQQLEKIYEMELKVDHDKSSFKMDDKIEYYAKNGSVCQKYFPVGDTYRIENISCSAVNQSFHFFKDLEPSWFQVVSDKYFLKSEYNVEVARFFQTEFPGSQVSNVELVLDSMSFSQIIFDVTVINTMYRFTITISSIGQTTIVLPSV